MVSDVRFVTLKVTTDNPELSIEIAQAYQIAIKNLGEEMVDIETISVFTDADSATEIVSDNRTIRMAVTGAVIGALVAILGIILQYVFDDSIYVANQFEQRYGIPVIGVCLRTKTNNIANETLIGQKSTENGYRLWGRQAIKLNYKAFTSGCNYIVAVDTAIKTQNELPFELLRDAKMKLEQDELLAIAMGEKKDEEAFFSSSDYVLSKVLSVNEDADVAEECAKADGVILLVQMGAHNGKLLERALDFLVKQQCNIVGALLCDGDPVLLKMYYLEALPFGGKNDKQYAEEENDTFKSDSLF